MKKIFLIILLSLFSVFSCEKTDMKQFIEDVQSNVNYPGFFTEKSSYISDLYLVYQGGNTSLTYTKEHLRPYVYTISEDGVFNWVYDGFLFLSLAGPGSYFGTAGTVDKTLYKWLMELHFNPDEGIPALNDLLVDLRSQGVVPVRKRKVVISIPGPMETTENWGEIAGKTLDMKKPEDRIAAVKWFIDLAMEYWKKGGYSELELAGFYWLHEGESANWPDQYVLPQVADYIHGMGLNFFWIPYFSAPMRMNWKEYGFDIAYLQPNYFFLKDPKASPLRLDDACQYASKYGMALEFECNYKMFIEDFYYQRFHDYLDYFEKNHVISSTPIAYYDDGGAIYELALSPEKKFRECYDRITKTIAERNLKADELYLQLNK